MNSERAAREHFNSSEGYRLDVPDGTYTVSLKFNEPFRREYSELTCGQGLGSRSKGFEEESEDMMTSSRPNSLVLFEPVFDNGPGGFAHDLVNAISLRSTTSEKTRRAAIVLLGTKDE